MTDTQHPKSIHDILDRLAKAGQNGRYLLSEDSFSPVSDHLSSTKDEDTEPPAPPAAHRVVFETTFRSETRNFHVNDRFFPAPDSLQDFGPDELAVGMSAAHLRDQLKAIKGVTDAAIAEYHVNISIGRAFEWSDIEPQVIAVLEVIPRLGR